MAEDRIRTPSPPCEYVTCDRHFLVEIKYDPKFGCPLCDAERRVTELQQIASGKAMTVTVQLDSRHIPPVVDSIADSIKRVSRATEVMVGGIEDINRKLGALIVKDDVGADPLCPKCNSEMSVRERKDGSGKFWSCTMFPKCKGTRPFNDTRSNQGPAAAPQHPVPEGTGKLVEF